MEKFAQQMHKPSSRFNPPMTDYLDGDGAVDGTIQNKSNLA
jgi:hypothetical protein